MTIREFTLLPTVKKYWLDLLLVVALASLTSALSIICAHSIDPSGFWQTSSMDVWFDADTRRVIADMTSITADHGRLSVHPLIALISYPPVVVLRHIGRVPTIVAVRLVIAFVAGLYTSLLFFLLRLIGCRRLDSTLFTLVSQVSGAAIFGLAVPETYIFGAVSILLALTLVVAAEQRKIKAVWYTIASALTLSFTVTNWLVGVLATALTHNWKQTLQITICALGVVLLLWSVEKIVFPMTGSIIQSQHELKFVTRPTPHIVKQTVRSFLGYSMVMPEVREESNGYYPAFVQLTAQHSSHVANSAPAIVGLFSWFSLLALGVWACLSHQGQRKLKVIMAIALSFQLLLHMIYGRETFLYSLHYMPLMVVMTALASLTKARMAALSLAVILIISVGLNNATQFARARHFVYPSAFASYQ